MARQCLVCQHEQKAAIDRELAAGTAIPAIAAKYRVSSDSLLRHKQNHLPAAIAHAALARETARGDDLLEQVRQLRGKAISILMQAERSGDLKTGLMGVREARSCVELLAEMEGELNRAPQINVVLSPQWIAIRAVIVETLAPYGEAKIAVAARLMALEGGQ